MLTAQTEAQYLAERRQEALSRLARQYPQFHAEPDPLTGGWLVRNEHVPGRITLVSAEGECSCRQGRLWDRCKHLAAVEAAR